MEHKILLSFLQSLSIYQKTSSQKVSSLQNLWWKWKTFLNQEIACCFSGNGQELDIFLLPPVKRFFRHFV